MAAEKGEPLDDVEKTIVDERGHRSSYLAGRLRAGAIPGLRAPELPDEVNELNEVQSLFLGDLAEGVGHGASPFRR